MVFHVGSNSSFSEIYIYDSDTQQIQFIDGGITNFDNTNVKSAFDKINNYVVGEFGNICICCNSDDTNQIRKNIIKHGIQTGFEKIEIIDEVTALYFSAVPNDSYKSVVGDLICIMYENKCYIWLKSESEVEMVIMFDDFDNLEEHVTEWCNDKGLNNSRRIFFHQNDIDLTDLAFNSISMDFRYKFEGYARAALRKALIMEEDSSREIVNTPNLLDRSLEIIVDKEQILSCNLHQKLPLKISKNLNKCEIARPLYILSSSNNNVKKIEEAIFIPAKDKYLLTFKIDKNGIFSFNLKYPDSFNVDYRAKQEIYYSRFTSKPINLLFQKARRHAEIFGGNEIVKNDVVGIDLGTTRCFASVHRRDGIEPIAPDNTSDKFLPSYVSYDGKQAIAGSVVLGHLRNHAKSIVFDIKTIIGKQFNEIKEEKMWLFRIVNGNNFVQLEVVDKGKITLKYPEEILAVLLKQIKQKAEEFQGRKLDAAVISCPVSFTKAQEDAIYVSALLAGWKRIHLLSDSIAAVSICFVERMIKINTLLLIFDLGGGNLNVSIVEAIKYKSQIIQLQGITNICCRDFDKVLFNYFKEKLGKCGIKVEKQEVIHKLLSKCEEIKKTLSVDKDASLDVDDFDASQDKHIEITRPEFENLSAHLLLKIKEMLVENLEFYNYDASQIDKVLLLGGGSRMPMIPTFIEETFYNAKILKEQHPDEMVARGALYYVRGDIFPTYAFLYKEGSRYLHIFL